jgi:hypothetical protein
MCVLYVNFKSTVTPRYFVSLDQAMFSLKILTGCVLQPQWRKRLENSGIVRFFLYSTQKHFFLRSPRSKLSSSLRFLLRKAVPNPILPRVDWSSAPPFPPSAFYSATRLAILHSSILITWPYNFNCRSSVSCNMFFYIPFFVLIVSFPVPSVPDILAERLT